MSTWTSVSPAPAVLRAGATLDLIAAGGRRPVRLPEIAAALGIARSSAANVCAALAEIGLIKEVDRGFVLGHKLVELSGYYLAAFDPIQRFNDYCRMHEEVHSYTLHLATLEGVNSMNVARSYGTDSVAVAPRVGQHLPANCTAIGKIMLAQFDDDEVRRRVEAAAPLQAMTTHSRTDVDEVLADIRATRDRGYAVNDEETYLGVYGVAVAVPDLAPGEGPYGVSCSTLKASMGPSQVDEMLQLLRNVASATAG
ncbi:IclR family transcriptional regulator [Jiangella mangrovi]|uniref:DNA-binding IclR family transcriptional regulator n=1 Tax=Jiangella mangrovi TaxID=1524084 RepID=A0A7W9LPB1_9ACTN|nr:IclR family transcriptional regulator [Jiangella mangrovi]MBB5791022.1 DNA-binding IclR family transcriptional regulator [Jiangella mangrovi]